MTATRSIHEASGIFFHVFFRTIRRGDARFDDGRRDGDAREAPVKATSAPFNAHLIDLMLNINEATRSAG